MVPTPSLLSFGSCIGLQTKCKQPREIRWKVVDDSGNSRSQFRIIPGTSSTYLASPKSKIRTPKFSSTATFSNFKSKCRIPAACSLRTVSSNRSVMHRAMCSCIRGFRRRYLHNTTHNHVIIGGERKRLPVASTYNIPCLRLVVVAACSHNEPRSPMR